MTLSFAAFWLFYAALFLAASVTGDWENNA